MDTYSQTNHYLRYYSNQLGGGLETFKGSRRGQFGNGLGDILSGIFRTILPIAAHGAGTFLTETIREKQSTPGRSWKDSARSALQPAAEKMLNKTISKISKATRSRSGRSSQRGKGGTRMYIGRRSAPVHHRRQRRKTISIRRAGGGGAGGRNYKRRIKANNKQIKFLNF